ncbi:MAG: hypothetical protein ACFFDR_03560 [Candidatus Thorarchaeota archaeon]
MTNDAHNGKRNFSIELSSKQYLWAMNLTSSSGSEVSIEGSIGELVHATILEGIVLQVTGKEGTLRLDLGIDEINGVLEHDTIEVKG